MWNHYIYTGEDKWIHLLYPHVCKAVQFFEGTINEKGLVEHVPLWVFIDWAAVDKNGAGAALNALYYGTLEYVGKMTEFKQDSFMAKCCRQRRERLRDAFQRYFGDGDRQVFIDSWADGVQGENVSEHTNALALLFRLADQKQASQIIRRLFEERSV